MSWFCKIQKLSKLGQTYLELSVFIRFTRTEDRSAKHFHKDGNPSETLHKTKQERLENRGTLTNRNSPIPATTRNPLFAPEPHGR